MSREKILKRLFQIVFTLFGITFITFSLMYLAPGDPVKTMYISSGGHVPSVEIIERTREALGLNDPFLLRYFKWVKNIFQGNFGMSYSLNRPVIVIIIPKILKSLNLALASLSIMIVVAFPLGIISAVKKNKMIDYLIRGYTFIGVSIPGFFLGTVLLYVVSLKLKLLPVISVGDGIKNLILPAVTLAFSMSVKYIRQIRTIVLDELSENYIVGAEARGINFFEILMKDLLPNMMIPLITLIGMSFGSLLSGVAVIEVIFSYPGIGKLAVDAISAYDYPLIQAYVLIISVIYMTVNFIVDISYTFLDYRISERE